MRTDKLTNRDISIHYANKEWYLMKSDFLGAFAYWVVAQSPYDAPNIEKPLKAFNKYITQKVKDGIPQRFTFKELHEFINGDIFETIPEIEQLNHPKISTGEEYNNRHDNPHPDFDFIDLGALATNIFYMLLRERITQ